MRRDSINYLAVGGMVLVATIMLLYALYRLTGGVDENTSYHVHYANVGGLREGTPVTYEGYKIGSVVGIEPDRGNGRTRYRVLLKLRDGWPIPVDSVAQIAAEGLLAETVINIEEGESADYLPPGSELNGALAGDVFAAVGDVATTVNGLLDSEVRDLVTNLDRRISGIGGKIDDRLPEVFGRVDQLLSTLQSAADRLPHFLDEDNEKGVERLVANGVDISDQLLAFATGLENTRSAADTLLRESRQTVADNRADLRRSMVALRRTLEELAASTDDILRNLDAASRNINEFSRQVRQNPGVLLSGKPASEVGVGR